MSSPSAATGGRRFRGLSSEERKAQRRRQLVAAGLEVFGTKGYHFAGVRDLCAEAKLTERYFYESFDNREALFLAVYEHAVSRVRDVVLRAVGEATSDVSGTARRALHAYLTLMHADPRLARILLIDVFSVGADVGRQSLVVTRSFANIIGDIVQAMHPDLDPRFDRVLLADGLVGSTIYIVVQWAIGGFKEPLERVLDHCALFYEALAKEALVPAQPALAPERAAPRAAGKNSRNKTSKGRTR